MKTFLAVKRLRHFGKAADQLFVTPAAVSARVKKLEGALGVQLIDRQTRDFELTPEGNRLVKHAERILADLDKASQEVAFGDNPQRQLSIAGLPSMWDFLLQDWMQRLTARFPDAALMANAQGGDAIQAGVLNGVLDLGFVFEPPVLAELVDEEVAATNVILVSTKEGISIEEALGDGYVFVDWGVSFSVQHERHFPDIKPPQYRMGRGRMARSFILGRGGAAYLAERTVQEGLIDGNLFLVEGAPIIQRSVHAIYLNRIHKKPFIEKSLRLFSKYEDDSIIEETGTLSLENS